MRSGAWLAIALLLSAFVLRASAEVQGWAIWGWLALVPIFLVIRTLPAPRAALAGMWWGFAYAIARVIFTPEGGASSVADLIAPVFIIGGYCFSASHLVRRIGFSPFILALGWIGVEFALGAFGWRAGLLDASVEAGAIGAWLSPLTGTIVAALVMAWASAMLAHVVVTAHAWVQRNDRLAKLLGTRPPLPLIAEILGSLQLASLRTGTPRGPPSAR